MTYVLSDIESIKTVTRTIDTYGVTNTTPVTVRFTSSQLGLGFIPDYVVVKQAGYVDTINISAGTYNVSANFIRDNDILFSVVVSTITSFCQYSLNLLHKFNNISQLEFTVTAKDLGALPEYQPSNESSISFTLEFVKLKNMVNPK